MWQKKTAMEHAAGPVCYRNALNVTKSVAPSFSTLIFHDQKMKIHDLSKQHIFPSKRYTTYECIPELTVPSARKYHCQKEKKLKSAQRDTNLRAGTLQPDRTF